MFKVGQKVRIHKHESSDASFNDTWNGREGTVIRVNDVLRQAAPDVYKETLYSVTCDNGEDEAFWECELEAA